MSAVLYGLGGMIGIGVLNTLITLINRKQDSFKTGFLIQAGNFILTLSLFPFLFEQSVDAKIFLGLFLAGATGVVAFVFINKALTEGKASINSPVISTWGVMTTVLGFIFLGEQFHIYKGISMTLIITGIFISSIDIKYLLKYRNLSLIPGMKWSIPAAFLIGISFFTLGYFTEDNNWYTVNLIARFWTIASYIALAMYFKKPVKKYFSNLPVLIGLAILVDVTSFLLINLGYTTSEPSVVSMLTSASPVPTIILSFLLLKERLTLRQLLGIGVVITGIILLTIL